MKLDYDYPSNILKRGRKLAESTAVSELEEAIKQIKVYSSFVISSEEHVNIIFEIVDLYIKLISYVESTQVKFWHLKMACVQLCEAFYMASKAGVEELKSTVAEKGEARLAGLLNVIGSGLNEAYAYLKSFQFRKTIEDKYGNKAVLRFLKEEPNKKYDRLYNQIYQQEDIFVSIEQRIDQAYLKVTKSTEPARPNIISMKEIVPFIEYNDADENDDFNFEHNLYFEMTEEIKARQKQGKASFVRFLLENYEITINDNYILTVTDEEVELYSRQIFEFFFKDNFNSAFEKDLVKFIQKIIKEERWL